MNCSVCKDLNRALESTLGAYTQARSAAFYRVSTEVAAKKEVDMERAKTDLQEHELVCPFAKVSYLEDANPPEAGLKATSGK